MKRLGKEKAEQLLATHEGPNNIAELVRDFNFGVRHRVSSNLRHKKWLAQNPGF